MPENIVGEDNELMVRRVREFLYVDIHRVRSYYAQMNRGIIDSVVSRDERSKSDISASLLGLGADGRGTSGYREESRSLQDLTYVLFEELFEAEGLISDIGPLASTPDAWASGRLHESLSAGQIIRYTGNLRILDPEFFAARVSNLIEFMTSAMGMAFQNAAGQASTPPVRKGGRTQPGQKAKSSEEVRQELIRDAIQEMLGGMSVENMEDLAKLAAAFTHNSISLRCFPCGSGKPQFNFAGALLSRSDYMQAEREELYSRHGNRLAGWTAVMQVARIPSKEQIVKIPNFDLEIWNGERINRVATEGLLDDFSAFMEALGFAEGSAFPVISVTPLAIYREFT